MVQVTETDAYGAVLRTNTYTYDEQGRLTATKYGATGHTYTPIYEKTADNSVYLDDVVVGVELRGVFTDKTTRDSLGRLADRALTVNESDLINEEFAYCNGIHNSSVTSDMVSEVRTNVGSDEHIMTYSYDEYGNINLIAENGEWISRYNYDKWHRLIEEINYKLGERYTLTYDEGGNIVRKTVGHRRSDGSFTDSYYSSYCYNDSTNKDRLTAYRGESCVYDALGNPTTYRDHALTWTKARKLAKYDDNVFEYNAQGLRVRKNNTKYILNGDKILKEEPIDYTVSNANTITYYYGGSGIIGFNLNGTDYYYRKNILGDVIEIYTASGTKVASYAYDAWGNHQITTNVNDIANINPIRYRGYYYDTETNLYYLQTRYYDPETGRFINPDNYNTLIADMSELSDKNLYAYCGNNPISRKDNGGEFWHIIAGVVIGAVVGAAVSAASQYLTTGEINLESVAISAASGAISGGLTAAGVPMGAMVAVNATLGAAESVYDNLTNGEPDSLGEVITDAAVSAGISAVFTLVGGKSNGKQMNAMYKANRQATKILTKTKGLNPKVKKELLKPIKTYFKTLGRYIVSEAKESPLSAFSSWGVNKLVEGTIDSYTGW